MSNVVSESQLRSVVREFLSNDKDEARPGEINEFMGFGNLNLSSIGELISDVPLASAEAFKQYLVEKLFKSLAEAGMPISDTSIVGRSIINTVSTMDWLEIGKYFASETACAEVADAIMKGVQQGFQEKGYDAVIQVMFGAPEARLQGILGSPFRELINQQFIEMTEELRKPIINFLCDHRDVEVFAKDMKAQLPKITGGSDSATQKTHKLRISPEFKIKEAVKNNTDNTLISEVAAPVLWAAGAAAAAAIGYVGYATWGYTPAQTSNAVLRGGNNNFINTFNKSLDEKYRELNPDYSETKQVTLQDMFSDHKIGLGSEEIVSIAEQFNTAVDDWSFTGGTTDEEGIKTAILACGSQWGVAQVAKYYNDTYDEELGTSEGRLYSELSQADFIKFVTHPINSLPVLTLDGVPYTKEEFFQKIKSAAAAEEEPQEDETVDDSDNSDDSNLKRQRLRSVEPPEPPPPPALGAGPSYGPRALTDIVTRLTAIPGTSKSYTLDDVYGEGAGLEMAEKVRDTFTNVSVASGIKTTKLNFTIKYNNNKPKKGSVQWAGRGGLQGAFSGRVNIERMVLSWFKETKRPPKISLDGKVSGSITIPYGRYE